VTLMVSNAGIRAESQEEENHENVPALRGAHTGRNYELTLLVNYVSQLTISHLRGAHESRKAPLVHSINLCTSPT
jgi:hypothetical protein